MGGQHGRRGTRGRQFQPRLLEDAASNVGLEPRRLSAVFNQGNSRTLLSANCLGPSLGLLCLQVPVRLSLPKRLTTRRSTTTERWAPCSPAMTRVADRASARPVFFTSANTSS